METPLSITYLALGDSYTVGTEIPFGDNYPSQIKDDLENRGLEVDLKVVAQNAWRTDDLLRGIIRADLHDQYDLVSLLSGVNNQYQGMHVDTYIPEFNALLDVALEKAGRDPNRVIVFSIPNYGYTPFGTEKREQITKELAAYNAAADSLCQQRGIDFYDVTDVSLAAEKRKDFLASDGLHPTGVQYAEWVGPYLNEIYKKVVNLK